MMYSFQVTIKVCEWQSRSITGPEYHALSHDFLEGASRVGKPGFTYGVKRNIRLLELLFA